MGVSIDEITEIVAELDFRTPPSVLDIGTQNLYRAEAAEIVAFIRRFNDVYDPEALAAYAGKMSLGSQFFPGIGGINGAWLGDLLVRAGVNYEALDIFHGYRTTIFDLNRDTLDAGFAGRFDVVLNAGTTEHVLNQFNCFKVIHEAAKVGGLIYHALPMTAHLNHGYFNYNPRFHFELAAANGYEMVWFKLDGPAGQESVIDEVLGPYRGLPAFRGYEETCERWQSCGVPVSAAAVLLRKITDAPFRSPMETSTTAGQVSSSVGARASQEPQDPSAPQPPTPAEVHEVQAQLIRRLNAEPRPDLGEIMAALSAHQQSGAEWQFPLRLEKYAIELALDAEDRDDLRTRLAKVNRLMADAYPLSVFAGDADLEPPGSRQEEADAIAMMPDGKARFARLVRLWRDYFDHGEEDQFPLDLELLAVQGAIAEQPDRPEIKVWLGRILARFLPEQPIARAEA